MKRLLFALLALSSAASNAFADPREIYEQNVHSVALVLNLETNSQGAAVVFDAERRLLYTVAHVVSDTARVLVFFPAMDEDGDLISQMDYYADEDNMRRLNQQGLLVIGRVAARDVSKDIAIIEVSELPKNATAVTLAENLPDPGDKLHVIGHPAERPLWNYSLVEADVTECTTVQLDTHKLDACFVNFYGETWHGNSGGPVFSDSGELVGVVSNAQHAGFRLQRAVDVKELGALEETLHEVAAITVINTTPYELTYRFRMSESEEWQIVSLPAGYNRCYWCEPSKARPQIEFDWNFQEGYQEAAYMLNVHNTLVGEQPSPADGQLYEFRVYGENSIRLANAEQE